MDNVIMGGIVLFFVGIFGFVVLTIFGGIFGIHYNVGNGSQVGYVSAVEKSGIFFKTGTAYIKPDLSSTQEDVYCVTDEKVFETLKQASVEKTRLEVKHESWMFPGVAYCNGEQAVIVGTN